MGSSFFGPVFLVATVGLQFLNEADEVAGEQSGEALSGGHLSYGHFSYAMVECSALRRAELYAGPLDNLGYNWFDKKATFLL
jgi:hypothetical protein